MQKISGSTVRENWVNVFHSASRSDAVEHAKDLVDAKPDLKVIVTGYQGSWQVEVKQ